MDELREKREKAQIELNAVTGPGQSGRGAPAEATQEELQERHALLEQILRAYDEQLNDALRLQEARQRHTDITRTSTEWTGFHEPPPYSIFLADQLWDAAYSFRLAAEGLQSQLNLISLRFNRARESLAAAEERLRQAAERLESTRDPAKANRQRWARDLEDLRKRAAAVRVSAAELSKTRVEEELADSRARLAFAQRQLATVEPHVDFSEPDLAKIRARLTEERQRLEGESERALVKRRAQSEVVQDAERQLQIELTKPAAKNAPAKEPRRVTQAKMRVELARADMDNLVLKSDLLQQVIDVVEGERQSWESRYAIRDSHEPGKAREAYDRLAPLFQNFQAARDYLRQQVGIVSGQISDLDNRLHNADSDAHRTEVQALLQTFRQRQDVYNGTLQRVDQATRVAERWKSEFKDRQKNVPLSARVDDWSQRAKGVGTALWNFEVFSAEDTIEVDGKKLTGRRSVTVGKIVSALTILVIGYVICLYLARLIGRLAVARFNVAPDVANLVRQWSQAFLITILIIVSFVSVKIPLTIFAFLGGAFAIGVGFGAQTLLKNVISGILVLIERPLRVGDLIEVDNVRGRVTSIGLRSSTVRDAKGMETLIPNSIFLERHLTNWTYSSRISRFSLRLGAPYGSSSRQVMDLLRELATTHPHVLKIPEPQVLLDEFGAQARIFTLNYWIEIRLDVDPSQVASELRFSIEEKFAEAGLKVLPAA
jgi:potassium-dependent mechanosensitive channel